MAANAHVAAATYNTAGTIDDAARSAAAVSTVAEAHCRPAEDAATRKNTASQAAALSIAIATSVPAPLPVSFPVGSASLRLRLPRKASASARPEQPRAHHGSRVVGQALHEREAAQITHLLANDVGADEACGQRPLPQPR